MLGLAFASVLPTLTPLVTSSSFAALKPSKSQIVPPDLSSECQTHGSAAHSILHSHLTDTLSQHIQSGGPGGPPNTLLLRLCPRLKGQKLESSLTPATLAPRLRATSTGLAPPWNPQHLRLSHLPLPWTPPSPESRPLLTLPEIAPGPAPCFRPRLLSVSSPPNSWRDLFKT